jgi:uncharacterized protein
MKNTVLATVMLSALGLGAPVFTPVSFAAPAVQTQASIPDPAAQYSQFVRAVRGNDIEQLLRLGARGEYDTLRAQYEAQRTIPLTDAKRKEFNDALQQFLAPDAIDKFMAENEPKLVEARAQFDGFLLMGMGAAQMALASDDSQLTAEDREALTKLLPAVQNWLKNADILNSQTLRKSATTMVNAVRATNVRTADDLQALSFEQALQKASGLMAAGKNVARLYQLDVDAALDSARFSTLERKGDTAKVRTTVTLFGTSISTDKELVYREGFWVEKSLAASVDAKSNAGEKRGVQAEKSAP